MSSDPYILSIDQGTTSSRAILFTKAGEIVDVKQKELTLHYPQKGWVEQDPEDIWADTLWACQEILKDNPDADKNIASIGITNQRETTILWNRETGKPIYNAIVWQDRRTAEFCEQLKKAHYGDYVTDKTGLLLDPYFSGTKIAWILKNVSGARKLAEGGKLAFGTVDTFLLWRLTGGKVHATDATNAARTMLFDIKKQKWDKKLLNIMDIPESLLPEVRDNCSNFGVTQNDLLGRVIPIGGIAGDQHAAVIGQACFDPGMVKSTYGTGCFALMNIGPKFKKSKNKLLTTTAYRFNGETTYAIEGAIFVAGAAMQWLRDELEFFDDAAKSEALATSVDDNGSVYFVPAFTGLGAPHWKPDARGMIMGLGRETTKAHITRAALEAQAYQTLDLMAAFVKDGGHDPAIIRADGGLVRNEFMCQFLSDMLDRPIEIPKTEETTALGAAYLAGLQAGLYDGLDDIAESWQVNRRYDPQMDAATRKTLYTGWRDAVGMILNH